MMHEKKKEEDKEEGKEAREKKIIRKKEMRGTGMKRGMGEKDKFIKRGGRERYKNELKRDDHREKEGKNKKEKKEEKKVLFDGKAFGVASSGGINRSKGKLFGRRVTSRYLLFSRIYTYTHMCMRFYLAVLGDVAG